MRAQTHTYEWIIIQTKVYRWCFFICPLVLWRRHKHTLIRIALNKSLVCFFDLASWWRLLFTYLCTIQIYAHYYIVAVWISYSSRKYIHMSIYIYLLLCGAVVYTFNTWKAIMYTSVLYQTVAITHRMPPLFYLYLLYMRVRIQ